MVKRQVFFSFEYKKDCWRASQIRNIGVVEGQTNFSDNEWEEIKKKSDNSIKSWIDDQLIKRSCVIVLIGETTYQRKWVLYEIQKAYEMGKGLLGIYIHRLKDQYGNETKKGKNPFEYVRDKNGQPLSKTVRCYNEKDLVFSTLVYSDIEANIERLIEEAIQL